MTPATPPTPKRLLRTLGGVQLELPDGSVQPLIGALRIALLAYLAVEGSRTAVTRDRLIGLFWPDVDDARARGALRNAIHQLRKVLGDEAVVARGEELAIDSFRLGCDVGLLDDAIARSDAEAAFTLYRGPFLQGFHASRVPEFEAWAAMERQRLEDRLFALCTARADEDLRGGRDAEAEKWSERACALRPDNEAAAQRLIGLHLRRGHYASALRTYDLHAAHLAREFEVRPSAAVEKLAALARQHGPLPLRVRTSDSALAVTEPSAVSPDPGRLPAPLSAGRSPEKEVPVYTTRQRLWYRALAGAAAAALLAGLGVWTYASRAQAGAVASSNRVLVLPFTTGDETTTSTSAFLDLFLHAFEGAPFDIVDGRALTAVTKRSVDMDPLRRATAASKQEAARYFVLGSATRVGETLHVAAALHDVAAGGDRLADGAVTGPASTLPYMAARLATELFAVITPGSGARLMRRAATLTQSADALRAYVNGELHFRQRRFNDAVDAFQRAVAADTGFALAYYRLSVAADWGSRPDLVHAAASRADQLADRLSLRERMLIHGLRAWREGRADDAERIFRSLTERYADDAEAWYNLGEILYHLNPPRGRDFRESRAAFERVLAADTTDTEAMTHLSRIAAFEGRRNDVRRHLDRVLAAIPTDDFELRAFRAFVSGTPAERDAIVVEARQQAPHTLWVTVNRLAVFGRDRDGAKRLATTLLDVGRLPDARSEGHKMLTYLALADGDTARARFHADALAAAQPGTGTYLRSVVMCAPWAVDTAGLRDLRAFVGDPARHAVADSGMRVQLRLWIAGLASYHLRDTVTMHRVIRSLDAIRTAPDTAAARAFSRSLRGLLHMRRGAYTDALPLLDDAVYPSSLHVRVARARALESIGRRAAAQAEYSTFFQASLETLGYGPWAERRLHALRAEAP